MTDRAWVATRKGLFELRRRSSGWAIGRASFLGEPVSMVLPPTESGRMLAALNLGHFGAKVHASDDGGVTWKEVATPTYPAQPAEATGVAWKLVQIWSMVSRGGTLWAGTLPGGLFRSGDGGESWQLNEALWHKPERAGWFGGGYDVPGIHSICPHPAQPAEMLVGISCGGAWVTKDDGATWALQASGMRAAYMPPDQAESPNTQDPHCIVRCAARPDVLWTRHLEERRRRGVVAGGDDGAGVELRLRGGGGCVGCRHRVVCARRGRPAAHPGGRRARRQSNARWRQDIRDIARRPAADGLLRPGLSTRPRGRPRREAAVDGQHDRQPVGLRRCGRFVGDGVEPPSADLRSEIRLNS
jgi:hypothetical protein